jgi:dihydropteroate synthase
MKLRCRDSLISLDQTVVMGVLNVTPDSFSDGGLWFDADAAVAHAVDMVHGGAGIVDVGGESTRPGAHAVDEHEETTRVIPVIERLVREIDVPVSIDTRKAAVARRAVDAGASIINNTSGEDGDARLDDVAVETRAAVIVMHSRGTPTTMQSLAHYSDVVNEVRDFLKARTGDLELRGVPRDAVVVDPGFGFAKTSDHNLLLLRRLDELTTLGYPVLVGTSRKAFIGSVLDLPSGERLEGTAATVAWAVAKGARIVRAHDVKAMARVVRVTEAISDATAAAAYS